MDNNLKGSSRKYIEHSVHSYTLLYPTLYDIKLLCLQGIFPSMTLAQTNLNCCVCECVCVRKHIYALDMGSSVMGPDLFLLRHQRRSHKFSSATTFALAHLMPISMGCGCCCRHGIWRNEHGALTSCQFWPGNARQINEALLPVPLPLPHHV